MYNHKHVYLAMLAGSLTLASTSAVASAVNKQLFLGGGQLPVCSSMAQSSCNNWDNYRQTKLAGIADQDIRTAVEEPVSVAAGYRARVVNSSAWAAEPLMQQAIDNALQALDSQQSGQPFASWDAFKSALIAVDAATVNVTINGQAIDGDYLWYDSSDEQWDAYAYLMMDDGLITYTPDNNKQLAAQQRFAGNNTVLNALSNLVSGHTYHYIDFITGLGSAEFGALSVEEQFALLRLFRDEVNYNRPIEYVAFNESNSAGTLAAYQAFVSMAQSAATDGAAKPTILVMTSSSSNSYDAADYYTALFEQAGANAVWLPLDRAWRSAKDAGNCADVQLLHDVHAGKAHQDIYFAQYAATKQQTCENPAAVLDMINSASGLFINGGSQERSLEALMTNGVDSPEMAAIRAQFEAGKLVIGGSSAGTAVQTGGQLHAGAAINPMINGGSSHDALRDGYSSSEMNAAGGLGVFHWGIADTHFSERAREGRLLTLAQQQGVRFGFGVDETTALLVTENDDVTTMEVVGENGVYIIDLQNAQVVQAKPLNINNVTTHFLNDGDKFVWDPQSQSYQIEFNSAATTVGTSNKARTVRNSDVLYEDNYRQMVSEFVTRGASKAEGTSYENDPTYLVTLTRQSETLGATNNSKASYQYISAEVKPK